MNILHIKNNQTLLRNVIQPQCCACAVRHIMRKPVTKLPTNSSKGTKMKKYVVPPHRVGVIKGWDSKHTGECSVDFKFLIFFIRITYTTNEL